MTVWIGEDMGAFCHTDLSGWWAVAATDDGRWAVKRLTEELSTEYDIAIGLLERILARVPPP